MVHENQKPTEQETEHYITNALPMVNYDSNESNYQK